MEFGRECESQGIPRLVQNTHLQNLLAIRSTNIFLILTWYANNLPALVFPSPASSAQTG
jgi:hypothetical protein